jgi:hypothetical protein
MIDLLPRAGRADQDTASCSAGTARSGRLGRRCSLDPRVTPPHLERLLEIRQVAERVDARRHLVDRRAAAAELQHCPTPGEFGRARGTRP